MSVFDQSIAELDRWSKGEPIKAAKLNAPVDAINRLVTGVAPPRQLSTSRPADTALADQVFSLKQIFADHYACTNYPADGGTTTLVAKWFDIRKSEFQTRLPDGTIATKTIRGITYRYRTDLADDIIGVHRDAIKNQKIERQWVIPRLIPGFTKIRATRMPTDQVNLAVGGIDLSWMEDPSSRAFSDEPPEPTS